MAATLVVGAITAPSTQSASAYSKKKGAQDEGSKNGARKLESLSTKLKKK